MYEEEKKAIEDFKKLKQGIECLNLFTKEKDEVDIKAIDIILHLIKKQQNKIEAQEMEHQYDQKMIDDLKGEMVHNWLHKDKIREKIEKIDKEYAEIIEKYKNNLEVVNINAQRHDAMQLILEELLEEN